MLQQQHNTMSTGQDTGYLVSQDFKSLHFNHEFMNRDYFKSLPKNQTTKPKNQLLIGGEAVSFLLAEMFLLSYSS